MIASMVMDTPRAKAAAAPNRPGCGWVISLTGMLVHAPFEPPLGDEPVAESPSAADSRARRSRARRRSPPPMAPWASAMSPATAPNARQKRSSAAVAQAVAAVERRRPQTPCRRGCARPPLLDRAQAPRRDCAGPAGGDPLDRDPAEAAPQMLEDPVLERVERGEVDVAAFGLDHVDSRSADLQQRGDAEPGAGADDR